MIKRIEGVLIVLGIVLLLWVSVSYAEILTKNTKENPTYSEANFFKVVFENK